MNILEMYVNWIDIQNYKLVEKEKDNTKFYLEQLKLIAIQQPYVKDKIDPPKLPKTPNYWYVDIEKQEKFFNS